ncbi:MAG: outer membrane protein [Gemmatimonadota bacterium]
MQRFVGMMGALVAIGALTAAPAQAQLRFTFSPFVGIHFQDDGALRAAQGEGEPEEAFSVDPGRLLGARFGVVLLERLGIEATAGFAKLNGEAENIGDFDFDNVEGDFSMFSVNARLNLSPGDRLNVFLTGGVGGATTDFDLREVDSVTDLLVTAGGGVSYPLTSLVSLRADVQSVVEFCQEPDQEEFGPCLEDATLTHIETSGGVEFTF